MSAPAVVWVVIVETSNDYLPDDREIDGLYQTRDGAVARAEACVAAIGGSSQRIYEHDGETSWRVRRSTVSVERWEVKP